MWDLKRDIVYKNDEMYNLMRALDIEDNIEHLRYDKVILATANRSNFITRQRRRVGDLGENVARSSGRPRLARVSMSSRWSKPCLHSRSSLIFMSW